MTRALPARMHIRTASRAAILVTALAASAPLLGAQGNTTPPVGSQCGLASDACVKAQDIFYFLSPQVGVALSGGNPMVGEGGSLGGWGRRSFALRVSVVDGRVPENAVTLTPTTTPVSSDFGAQRAPVPVPSFDAAIGVFRGVPVGLTNVGGVDLLLGATVVPSLTRDELTVESDGSGVAINYGVRIGLLQESAVVPGVGISVMRRRLPTTSISYRTSNDTLNVLDTRVSSTAIRLTVNKRFGLFGIGGGIGEDRIESEATLQGVVNESVNGVPARAEARLDASDKTSRGTAFLNASFGLAMAQVVVEVGQSRAGTILNTLNTFGERKVNEAYRYGSIGFNFRL